MLHLVNEAKCQPHRNEQVVKHHEYLLESYFKSHSIRNYSPQTIVREKRFLDGWFSEHGIYTWEAMAPVTGRKRIQEYGQTLLDNELCSQTVRSYLGILRRYFGYVLEYPFVVIGDSFERIQTLYGAIDQPVTEYDIPHHVYDGERLGVPLDPEKLYDFFSLLRTEYLGEKWQAVKARNYTLTVLAGESGLRADELLHLETKDLFFESKKLQTRFAKGTKGSGKRARVTLFPPLARDTVRHYLTHFRPELCTNPECNYLFVSQSGQRLTYVTIHNALKEMVAVAQMAGLPVASHLSWHWFRRIFATRFIERFPHRLAVLIDLLGHVTPNTVHRYIRHSEAWMDQEIQNVLEGSISWPSIGD